MELNDGEATAAKARVALLQELAKEREAGTPEHLFGAPRLERFLQGNGGSVLEAAAHFRRMLRWREEVGMATRRQQVVGKPWSPDSVPGFRALLRTMAADVMSYTREGDLLWVQCDGLARLDQLMKLSDEELFSTVFLMCELRQDHLDGLSAKRGRLVKAIQVRDLSGLSISGLLRDRAIMGRLKEALRVVNVAYPESVQRIVLLNLPPGFNLLWAALQPLMNARIRQKFRFLTKDNYAAELAALAGVEALEALVRARHQAQVLAGRKAGELEVTAGHA